MIVEADNLEVFIQNELICNRIKTLHNYY